MGSGRLQALLGVYAILASTVCIPQPVGATFLVLTLVLPVSALGVAVFSQRALPLAAWTNGLELAGVKTDTSMGSLILETGVNNQFRCVLKP